MYDITNTDIPSPCVSTSEGHTACHADMMALVLSGGREPWVTLLQWWELKAAAVSRVTYGGVRTSTYMATDRVSVELIDSVAGNAADAMATSALAKGGPGLKSAS